MSDPVKQYAWARVSTDDLSRNDAYDFTMNHWIQKTIESGTSGLRDVVLVYCSVQQTEHGLKYIPVPLWEMPEASIED